MIGPNLNRRWNVPRILTALTVAIAFAGCQASGRESTVDAKNLTDTGPRVEAAAGVQLAVQSAAPSPTGGQGSEGTGRRAVEAPALSVPDLAKLISPAVVHISTRQLAVDTSGRPVPEGGVGTGFIIDEFGHVLTNNHVVADAKRILVTTYDGRAIEADLIGRDPLTDVAVLQIDPEGISVAQLGESSDLEVGEQVVAVGHALDLPGGPTVTVGVVSALDRTLTNVDGQGQTLSALIQTDASINPGNSGGPLLDITGRVVGINTAGIVGSQNVGFAISIDSLKPIIDELITFGRIERGFLGIVTATITRFVARQNELPVEYGVYVVDVSSGTAAARAGLQQADIIIEIAGDEVSDSGDLSRILARHKPGSTVAVRFHRSEETSVRTVQVTLGSRPDP